MHSIPKRHLAHLVIATLSLASFRAVAADGEVRVANYAPLHAEFTGDIGSPLSSSGEQRKASNSGVMRFNVFGKNYSATLRSNSNIELPANATAEVYKGAIDGRANSWIRLTKIGTELHGLIFDGSEVFAVEPAQSIGADPSLGAAIFRLADAKTDIDAQFCDALNVSNKSNGLDMFKALSGESKTILSQMQKSGARTRLQISALMDLAFRGRFASDQAAIDAVATRVNNIDGIFSAQLGIEVELKSATAPETPGAPLFGSTIPDTLLQAVARVRSETPALYSTGITHLFTGSDLEGKTIGIAYMDSVCGQRYGASLSEVRDRGAWFDSLVAAHELGHTFGGVHDGEGECAATPTTFLMAPTINGNERFSQCSLNRIQTRMQTASCLIAIPLSDASVPASIDDYHAAVNSTFSWSLPVANIGNAEAGNVQVELTLPTALIAASAEVAGGSCTIGGGIVACSLGNLAAQASRSIELRLKGSQAGSHSISATVTSTSDANAGNNAVSGIVRIDPLADVSLSLSSPAAATVGQAFDATFAVANKSATDVQNLSIEFTLPAGISVSGSPQLDGFVCQREFSILRCSTASLTAGRSVSGTLSLIANEVGAQSLTATLNGDFSDPQPTDNSVQRSISVSAAPATASSGASSQQTSGGGSIGNALLGLLSIFALVRRRFSAR